MKKWFVLAIIVCAAVAVQAGEGEGKKKGAGKGKGPKEQTKEQFCAQQKRMAEKKGLEADMAKIEAKFDKLDKNKDGKLSADEKPARKKKGGKPEKKGEKPEEKGEKPEEKGEKPEEKGEKPEKKGEKPVEEKSAE